MNYDAIDRTIMRKVTAPTGLIIHTAGFTAEGSYELHNVLLP